MKKMNLKKLFASALVMTLVVASLSACGKKEESDGQTVESVETEATSEESTEAKKDLPSKNLSEVKADDYVSLGDYQNLAVNYVPEAVKSDDVDTLVNSALLDAASNAQFGITDRAVAMGDTANIDFVGTKDGVAFDGGTGNSDLTIGSGQFIPGFEEELVGVMPGDTKEFNITFPEDYAEELAGQEVTFSVTVNYIIPTEYTDEMVATLGIEGVNTIAELTDYATDYLQTEADNYNDAMLETSILNGLTEATDFAEVPQEFVNKYILQAEETLTAYAASYGIDKETYVMYMYGEEYDSWIQKYALETAKQFLAMQAIADAEGLSISDEELDAKLLEEAKATGCETIEEYIGSISKEDYREYYMYLKVMEYLKENVTVNEQ